MFCEKGSTCTGIRQAPKKLKKTKKKKKKTKKLKNIESVLPRSVYVQYITKTRLFKYIENFISKN